MKVKKENRNKGKYKQTVLKTGKVSGSKHAFLEHSDTYIQPHWRLIQNQIMAFNVVEETIIVKRGN